MSRSLVGVRTGNQQPSRGDAMHLTSSGPRRFKGLSNQKKVDLNAQSGVQSSARSTGISVLRWLKQKAGHKLEASLSYRLLI